MTMAIVKHGLPFKFVEYKWTRELLSYLNPDVKHVSWNIVTFRPNITNLNKIK